MAKVSKLSKMSKTICLHSLLGLLASVIISSCFYDIQNDLEQENRGHCGDDLVQLQSNVARSFQDGSITLAIKFLHFSVSKGLQFRYVSPMQPAPSTISMMFWVALTRSVSSMSNDSL
ncbi:hypothetical protein CJ030_MR8G020730 [Morella rubra]|uniref:Uncharacterized protein n=1 Tax=Morella rubra TaxID=262757 RepID=A0A6A1UU41_9ROSI|nr:hypothetical protein CJ030_MR8G020730 [Morella rubra]